MHAEVTEDEVDVKPRSGSSSYLEADDLGENHGIRVQPANHLTGYWGSYVIPKDEWSAGELKEKVIAKSKEEPDSFKSYDTYESSYQATGKLLEFQNGARTLKVQWLPLRSRGGEIQPVEVTVDTAQVQIVSRGITAIFNRLSMWGKIRLDDWWTAFFAMDGIAPGITMFTPKSHPIDQERWIAQNGVQSFSRDGVIDDLEWMLYMCHKCHECTDLDSEGLFRKIDRNRDRVIVATEWKAAFEGISNNSAFFDHDQWNTYAYTEVPLPPAEVPNAWVASSA
eukprot:gnl/MRDRNA2_/MRDRNA2_64327_c0_seq2.p1 gnl/MRDRNA2_/MRDRNA2_64327_c0~~gnl/MRDRNA2_/MRDRNA2_64327_c0_seq2.p1  ORF type:complete len:281 (+),score=34.86 gnl/MRDRNA2_/MRDRNA2_64327_c0_seq2:257-1099(+)